MTPRSVVVFAIGAIILGVAYYWLTLVALGASVYLLAPGPWLKHSVGLRYGIPIWSLFLNTIAIALAAVPVAVLAKIAFGRRAVLVALAAAIGVSGYVLVETLWVRHSFPRTPALTWYEVTVSSFDCLKVAALPAFFVWIGRGWPPNFLYGVPRQAGRR